MVTLKDVAKAAGVHLTTVSSVLNGASGNSRFGETTRRKVERVAKRLGYTSNLIARSLRTRKTSTVGLVAGNLQNPFFAALSHQLETHLHEQGYALVLTCHGADSASDERKLAQTLLARSVDGLLIWSEQRGGRTLRMPPGSTKPRVWLGHGPPSETAVTVDIAKGLEFAVQHLLKLGCRRLGYFAPSYAESAGMPKSRPDLFDAVCSKLAVPPAMRFLFPGQSWNLAAAMQCAIPLIATARDAGVEAIVAYNDVSAVAWRLAATQQGFSVPVIGFDGSPLIKAWRPPIPYVDLHSDTLARAAVEALVTLMQGRVPPQRRTVVQPSFVKAAALEKLGLQAPA